MNAAEAQLEVASHLAAARSQSHPRMEGWLENLPASGVRTVWCHFGVPAASGKNAGLGISEKYV